MKLYIWRNIANNYAPGFVFAFANSEEEAREMILKNTDYFEKPMEEEEWLSEEEEDYLKILEKPDEVYDSPYCEVVSGSQ